MQALLPITTNNEFISTAVVESGTNAFTFGTATTPALGMSMGTMESITLSTTVEDPRGGTNNRATSATAYRPVAR